MMDSIGWLSGMLLSFCGVPQAWVCYRTGKSDGISNSFLAMWFAGEALVIPYVLSFDKIPWPLIVNYGTNMAVILVIIYYKIWPRKDVDKIAQM
jgi:uncharacterized protein with PQ loop repeat